MKIENYQVPKSSFLSIDKDTDLIISKLMKNERLKRLLHYTTRDCISKPNLSEEESLAMFGKEIRTIPRFALDGNVTNYIVISFDHFSPNATNPHFRDNIIEFDIICHFDQWQLDNGQLRPYRIAAEIDSMFDNTHLTGIGTLEFLSAKQTVVNDEFAGITLLYTAIHGDEDQKHMIPQSLDEQFVEEFNELWNN